MQASRALFTSLFVSFAVPCLFEDVRTSNSVNVYQYEVWSNINYRLAVTRILVGLRNEAASLQRADLFIPLPEDNHISNFYIFQTAGYARGNITQRMADCSVYRAPRRARRLKVPGLDLNEYMLSLNIPAGGYAEVHLTYQGLLRRRHGIYSHVVYVNPGQVVERMYGTVHIRETREIRNLRVFPLRNFDNGKEIPRRRVLPRMSIQRNSGQQAFVQWSATERWQHRHSPGGIAAQFTIQYDIDRGSDIGDFQSIAGYFVHYVAPLGLPMMNKDVVFVVDVSGAVRGDTLAYTQGALVRILARLHSADRFSLITYNQNVTIWPETRHAEVSDVTEALEGMGQLRAGGGADLHAALTSAMNRLLTSHSPRPLMIVLLTASPPSSGETRSVAILRHVRDINTAGHVSVFSVALTSCVNFNFLLRLSSQNKGFIRRVHAETDVAEQIVNIYDEIASPVLTGVRVSYPGDKVARKVMDNPGTLYEGGEILVAGELRNSVDDVTVDIMAESANGSYHHVANITMADAEYSARFITNVWSAAHWVWRFLSVQRLGDSAVTSPYTSERNTARTRAMSLSQQFEFFTRFVCLRVDHSPAPDMPNPEVLLRRVVRPSRSSCRRG